LQSNIAQAVVNRVYMIKDYNVGLVGSDLAVADTSTGSNLFDATAGGTVPANALGWAVTLSGAGEKIVNGPLVVAGHVLFGTNKPDTSGNSCTANLGIAQRYDISMSGPGFNDVAISSTVASGGGFLPSVVAGVVEIDGKKYLFTTDNPLNPGGPNIKPVPSNKRRRSFWRQVLE